VGVRSDDAPGASQPFAPPEFLSSRAAPEPVSGASLRLRALAALSGSLTDSLTPEDAASLVEEKALSALGATSAVVVTLGPFPSLSARVDGQSARPAVAALHVVHAIGLPDEVKAMLDELPLDAPVPLAEVARAGSPMFLHDEHALRVYPAWGAAMIAAGARAAAIVPVWANGELRGVLGLAWAESHDFDQDERAFVLTLGVMCAQAIMRSRLRHAELQSRESAVQAREEAEHANRSKARFLATISHELRTPLNAVLGYTQLVADEIDGPVSELQRDHLGRVRASGRHLLGLIEDLLGYARIEAGEEAVHVEHVLLADVVSQSVVLIDPLAASKGLDIRIVGSHEAIMLHTDGRKVCQILVNLLANAVKFSDSGDIELLVRVSGVDADITVFLEVTDTGLGIAVGDHEHIFDPFWQTDQTHARNAEGTGLGLSVARQLARLLGGDLTVTKSSLGDGSTFVVSLPTIYSAAPLQ
jgi:signal transduction histidine kinase